MPFDTNSLSHVEPTSRCTSGKFRLLCASVATIAVVVIVAVVVMTEFHHTTGRRTAATMMDALDDRSFCSDEDDDWHNSARSLMAVEPVSFCKADLTRKEHLLLGTAEHHSSLLGFLYVQVANRSNETMLDILRGAHVVMNDPDRRIYDTLTNMPGAFQVTTFLKSDLPQQAIVFDRNFAFLVGSRKRSTWFRFEATGRTKSFGLEHVLLGLSRAVDWTLHVITRRNIGPLGRSNHTESDPLRVDVELPEASSACPGGCSGTAKRPRPWSRALVAATAPDAAGSLGASTTLPPEGAEGNKTLEIADASIADVPRKRVTHQVLLATASSPPSALRNGRSK